MLNTFFLTLFEWCKGFLSLLRKALVFLLEKMVGSLLVPISFISRLFLGILELITGAKPQLLCIAFLVCTYIFYRLMAPLSVRGLISLSAAAIVIIFIRAWVRHSEHFCMYDVDRDKYYKGIDSDSWSYSYFKGDAEFCCSKHEFKKTLYIRMKDGGWPSLEDKFGLFVRGLSGKFPSLKNKLMVFGDSAFTSLICGFAIYQLSQTPTPPSPESQVVVPRTRVETVCTRSTIITSVGGCNFAGYCGVTFSNGTSGGALLPTIGESVCVRHKNVEVPY